MYLLKLLELHFAFLYLDLTGPFLDAISISIVGHVRQSVIGTANSAMALNRDTTINIQTRGG